MGERYETMAEIWERYPKQWVLINRPRKTKRYEVLGGYVIYHGPDKLAMEEVIDTLPRPFDIATRYTGPILEDDEEWLLNWGWTE